MTGEPLVALTATTKQVNGRARVYLNEAYAGALRQAGLVPLILPPLSSAEARAALAAVRGLVLTGGEDVDPACYGAAPHPRTQPAHHARDHSEIELARAALEMSLPTLAICRGLQVVNVAFGGSLVQDIAAERPSEVAHEESARRTERVHAASIEPDTRLAAILDAPEIRVNTSHHQSLDIVAKPLRVNARAPDGIVEGAEWRAPDWWMVGVQWHPEELLDDPDPWERRLFDAFAKEVQRVR